ncbi:SusC/RagA family TonB-linked outer membrane protein [Gramella sp. AN32]|uniref:SusC/RagA family TonB-linked outer membrane protein n=1 Tax=Christiangramia antarctica TaxID=2058158 RepID=A0ABW5X1Z1_9FLAO|nr:SusC/RagA family TonB-linked outer membrane protein [Gramella sp. AN32]MCM4155622.1 SusC/RagA family TonB-linked outer membrane protein [Gramella sp. AN32]
MKNLFKGTLLMLFMIPMSFFAQNQLSGSVSETATGLPVPGVNVIIKGTSTGTITDFDGNYILQNVANGDVVVFSFLGFATKEIPYTGQATIDVSLEEDAATLDEIVLIGYGSVKKKDATGSVSTISPEEFNKGAVVAADQLIQGKVAGIQVINGGGSPGEGAQIRIRSGSSLNANNDPLYVIDGVPVDSGGIEGGRNPLATINQNDIESINILKDASATAIYGVRASNGVVIVTTKRGKSGELKISYNSTYSYSTINKTVDALTPVQFREYVNANGNEAQIGLIGDSNTNWQDLIYRDAFGTDQSVSATGGKDFYNYRVSTGFANYAGILKRDNFQRTTMSAALTFRFLDDHLRFDINNNNSIIESNYSNRGAIGSAIAFDPTQPVYVDDQTYGGYFRWTNPNNNRLNTLAPANPLALINQTDNYGKAFRSIGNLQTEYKMHFLPELKAVLNLGYDMLSGRSYGGEQLEFVSINADGERSPSSYNNVQNKENRLLDAYLNYNKYFEGSGTNIDLTGGYNYQDFRYPTTFFTDDGNGVIVEVSNETRLNLQSYFARLNLTQSDKYLLTLSIRRDGTSRFTEENRWGNFPAAAIGWKVNEENFLKGSDIVSNLKFRGSWGITGQQEVGDIYPSLPLYQTGTNTVAYQFGNQFVQTIRPQPYNTNLVWEETETYNAGIDFGFFDERVTGAIDAYERTTTDLLVFTNNPQGVGFSNADDYNIGTLENRGLEIAADVYPFRNDNLTWRLGGNITFQESKITELTLIEDPDYTGLDIGGIGGATGNTIQNHQVGYAPYSFFVFEQAYGADGRPLDGVYVDRNQDGIVNEADKYRYRKPASDVYYGINTDLNYANWNFNMSWRGSWGNYNYNNVDSRLGYGDALLIFDTYVTNGVENLLETNFTQAQYQSDYYIQDASFVKLDNASIGYTFDSFLNDSNSLTITATGQNLLIISDYSGIDPETYGIDNNLYPRPMNFVLGFNFNF